jgi:hypothetical protein
MCFWWSVRGTNLGEAQAAKDDDALTADSKRFQIPVKQELTKDHVDELTKHKHWARTRRPC